MACIFRSILLFAAATALLMSATEPAAADEADGRTLFMTRTCVACHGRGGAKAIQMYPHLAGLPQAYLYEQMTAIAAGERVSGPDARGYPRTQAMKDVMKIVTDDELKTISIWLSTQPAPPIVAGDPEKVAAGAAVYAKGGCPVCHGKEGGKPLAGYPIIAGQKKVYLALQIKEIHDGVRANGKTKLMTAMIKRITDADIEVLAEYLSSTPRPAAP